jgi:hypothetical protein
MKDDNGLIYTHCLIHFTKLNNENLEFYQIDDNKNIWNLKNLK